MLSMSLRDISQKLTAPIRKSFSQPPRRLIQGAKETIELRGSHSRVLWVLSRYFLRQKVFELAEGLAESKRKSALALLVRKWSPYGSTGFAAHWVGRRATVYAWDAAKADAAIIEAGLPPSRCTIWPETFMREPLQDGIRLATMIDGVEGQVWRQGLLAATRWWPVAPSTQEWIAFLRAAAADLSQSLPPQPISSDLPLLSTPWISASAPITDFWSLIQNDRAAAIAAVVLTAPFLYLLGEASVLGVAGSRLNGTMADLSQANMSIRMERSEALTDLDAIGKYLSLEPYPPNFR